jgi:hypothetical protein
MIMEMQRLVLLLLASATAVAADQLPRLITDSTVRDLGRIPPRWKATATFTLRNAGKAPLNIVKVMSAEGVQTTLTAKVVRPGRSSVLKVSFTAGVLNEPREEKVFLISNDPVTPFLEFTVRATITPLAKGDSIIVLPVATPSATTSKP